MLNNNNGVDPANSRQFPNQFNGGHLSGIPGLQGNFTMQNALQGGRPGLGGLPASAAPQPTVQGRFGGGNFGQGLPQQYAPAPGRGGVQVAMNGLPPNAGRGPVGSGLGGMNLPGVGARGLDRGQAGTPLGAPPAAPGLQQRGNNMGMFMGGQGRGVGGLGGLGAGGLGNLGAPMGNLGNALGLGTSPNRTNTMNNLHGMAGAGLINPSGDLLAMINKGQLVNPGGMGAFGGLGAAGQGLGPGNLGSQAMQGQQHKQQQQEKEPPAFDASEFPALGATRQAGNLANGDGGGGGTGLGGLGEAPYSNLANLHKAQMGGGQFSIQNEQEFPALPGAGATTDQRGNEDNQGGQQQQQQPQQQQQQQGLQGIQGQQGFQQRGIMGAFRQPQQQQPPPQQQQQPGLDQQQQQMQNDMKRNARIYNDIPAAVLQSLGGGQGPATQDQVMRLIHMQQQQRALEQTKGSVAAPDRFGLLGLLGVIRMSDPDLTTLALGTDLTGLGLHLNSPENVYKTFASPWAEAPLRPEPDFKVPECYRHAPPRLQPGYFTKFAQETLFYIFYSMPGDEAQLFAADELQHRGWAYHKEFKVWLTAIQGVEPQQKNDQMERSSYYVFDTAIWEAVRKDNFVLHYDAIERLAPLQRAPLPVAPAAPAPAQGS